MTPGNVRPGANPKRAMVRSAALLGALTVWDAACAAKGPIPKWAKTRDSAEDLQEARETCKQLALAEAAAATRDAVAAPVGAGTFFKCMASKGWVQVAKATSTPGH